MSVYLGLSNDKEALGAACFCFWPLSSGCSNERPPFMAGLTDGKVCGLVALCACCLFASSELSDNSCPTLSDEQCIAWSFLHDQMLCSVPPGYGTFLLVFLENETIWKNCTPFHLWFPYFATIVYPLSAVCGFWAKLDLVCATVQLALQQSDVRSAAAHPAVQVKFVLVLFVISCVSLMWI